jgi:hypothetical protein
MLVHYVDTYSIRQYSCFYYLHFVKLWLPKKDVATELWFSIKWCRLLAAVHIKYIVEYSVKLWDVRRYETDEPDIALLIYTEDEESSENENHRLEYYVLFKIRAAEGVFLILVRRHVHRNDEQFRQHFRWTPILFNYVLKHLQYDLTPKPYKRHKILFLYFHSWF